MQKVYSMENVKLDLRNAQLIGQVNLPLSKSICNRLLILQAQLPQLSIAQLSDADDTQILAKALQSKAAEINLGAAGTAFRFATAFFAAQAGREVVLTGRARMLQRPIADLVNALQSLGADVDYVGEAGFPPLRITGKKLLGGEVGMSASTSSQFASALLLIAPSFEGGLTLRFSGEVVSKSYIRMTTALMKSAGVAVAEHEHEIAVLPAKGISPKTLFVEADWSAAAYYFGFVALADEATVQLNGLQENSTQGDARLVQIFEELGVKSTFKSGGLLLEKRTSQKIAKLAINLNDNPDLAQPLAVTCAALGIGADFRGLQTLKIKETDRLLALKIELAKVGVDVKTTENSLSFEASKIHPPTAPFKTYEDHRMAMSFALLACKFPVEIENPEVVRKSYPNFFLEVERLS